MTNHVKKLHPPLWFRLGGAVLKVSRHNGHLPFGEIGHVDRRNKVGAASTAYLAHLICSAVPCLFLAFTGLCRPILLSAVVPVISLILKGHEFAIRRYERIACWRTRKAAVLTKHQFVGGPFAGFARYPPRTIERSAIWINFSTNRMP